MKKALYIIIVAAAAIALLSVIGKKTLTTEIIIDAPADAVWREFTNFSEYPRWNPFIKKISGEVKTGNRIQATIQPEGGKAMIFKPVILSFEEDKILQWEGRLLLPGIFTGKHMFQFIKINDHKTKFIQKENFNGILVPFFDLNPTLKGFKSMNELLKKRVEK